MSVLRVLDTGAGAPAWNMALDEALLWSGGPATLRLYTWMPAGLSLGHFQDIAPFRAVPGPHRIVRRHTGGGAIYHADEITFALAVDARALPGSIADSYVLLHRAVQRALAAVGVETTLVPGEAGCAQRARPREPWCFATPGAHDLVLSHNGRKIVGSAQRRVRAPTPRVLHHGSLVQRAPAATPFCGAVADVVDADTVTPALRRALVREIAAALGLRAEPAVAPTAPELAAAMRLRDSFANPAERARPGSRRMD